MSPHEKKKKFLILKLRREKKILKIHFPLSKICVNVFLRVLAY